MSHQGDGPKERPVPNAGYKRMTLNGMVRVDGVAGPTLPHAMPLRGHSAASEPHPGK